MRFLINVFIFLTGYIRDVSGDYSLCIFIQCGLMAAAMFSWIIEMSVTGYRKRSKTNHIFVPVRDAGENDST